MDSRRGKPEGGGAGSAHRSRGRQERQLRIIAGRWRGRRWRFPASALRPTPDRVRETLFNWLQGRVPGAHCLDLFAGSGALGLEALSRGAASVTFVEQDRAVAGALEALLREWQAGAAARVVCAPARNFLAARQAGGPHAAAPQGFGLVFLDPPFASGELGAAVGELARGWLTPEARIYVEHARAQPLPPLPAGWQELRAGSAGEVGYHLFAPAGGATA